MVQEWERMAQREQQWRQEQHDPFARILECGGPQQLFDDVVDDAFSELGGGAAAAAALRDRQQDLERAPQPPRVSAVTVAAAADTDAGDADADEAGADDGLRRDRLRHGADRAHPQAYGPSRGAAGRRPHFV